MSHIFIVTRSGTSQQPRLHDGRVPVGGAGSLVEACSFLLEHGVEVNGGLERAEQLHVVGRWVVVLLDQRGLQFGT